MTEIHRAYAIAGLIAFDESTYYPTSDAEDTPYVFAFDGSREDLRSVASETVEDHLRNARLESVGVDPAGVSVTVRPGPGRGERAGLSPGTVSSALTGVVSEYNDAHATAHADGESYLDGVETRGQRYVEAVRPEDALTPEEWIDTRCPDPEDFPDHAPDPSEPALEYGPGVDFDRPPEADADRNLCYSLVVPIDPETWEARDVVGEHNDGTYAFELAEADVDQLTHLIDSRRRWGDEWRLEVWTRYIRVDARSESLSRTPTRAMLAPLKDVLGTFNQHRRELDVEGAGPGRTYRRPELETGDEVYVGAALAEGHADHWIEANDLGKLDGTPIDPPPEPDEPEDVEAEESDEDEWRGSRPSPVDRLVNAESRLQERERRRARAKEKFGED